MRSCLASETEEVKNRANEIDKMAVVETPITEKVETTENTSKVEDKNQVEEKTLATKVNTAGHKELKTDSNKSSAKTNIKPEESKTVVKNTDIIERELKRCADELAACDVSMQTIRNLICSEQ